MTVGNTDGIQRGQKQWEYLFIYLVVLAGGKRFLFHKKVLDLHNFKKGHRIAVKRLGDRKEDFIERLRMRVEEEVYRSDLWKMLYIAETDSEIDIFIKMLKRYFQDHIDVGANKQFVMISEAKLKLGPEIMRLLHIFKKSDTATQLIMDEDVGDIFNSAISYQIYMDLLYECGKYEDAIEFYEEMLKKRKGRESDHLMDSNHTAAFMAALYKLNTKESMEKAVQFLRETYHKTNKDLSHRVKAFAAVLALNQNMPQVALDIIDMDFENSYVGNLNTALRMKILIRLHRLDEAYSILKSFKEHEEDVTRTSQIRIFSDCVEDFEKALENHLDVELKEKVAEIKDYFQKEGLIHKYTFIDMLEFIPRSKHDALEVNRTKRVDKKYYGYKIL